VGISSGKNLCIHFFYAIIALSKNMEIIMNDKKNKQIDAPLGAEFLTRKEAAMFLRLSLASFDKLKGLRRIKYGKSIRFFIGDLRAYAEEHTVGGKKDE
jgi:hypothetical protein